MKQLIEVKSDLRRHGRDLRHLHFLVSKSNKEKNEAAGNCEADEDEVELLSDFIPCDTYHELQILDGKLLTSVKFFVNSVG